MRMRAYYFGFSSTNVELIDRILSAVACGGKAYHHTEDWGHDCEPWETFHRGNSVAEWIQRAAEDAAADLTAKEALLKDYERQMAEKDEALAMLERRLREADAALSDHSLPERATQGDPAGRPVGSGRVESLGQDS